MKRLAKPPFLALVLLSAMLLPTTGCVSTPDESKTAYTLAATSFADTVTVLAVLREQGKLSTDQVGKIDPVVQAGYRILTEWKTALDVGTVYDGTSAIAAIVAELAAYSAATEGN